MKIQKYIIAAFLCSSTTFLSANYDEATEPTDGIEGIYQDPSSLPQLNESEHEAGPSILQALRDGDQERPEILNELEDYNPMTENLNDEKTIEGYFNPPVVEEEEDPLAIERIEA